MFERYFLIMYDIDLDCSIYPDIVQYEWLLSNLTLSNSARLCLMFLDIVGFFLIFSNIDILNFCFFPKPLLWDILLDAFLRLVSIQILCISILPTNLPPLTHYINIISFLTTSPWCDYVIHERPLYIFLKDLDKEVE